MLIATKDSAGHMTKSEYNEQGLLIYFEDNKGYKYCKEYNEQGLEIHFKSTDFEQWRDYDCNGNEIHYKDSNGYEVWYKYDEYNTCIFTKITGDNYESIITRDIEYYN